MKKLTTLLSYSATELIVVKVFINQILLLIIGKRYGKLTKSFIYANLHQLNIIINTKTK